MGLGFLTLAGAELHASDSGGRRIGLPSLSPLLQHSFPVLSISACGVEALRLRPPLPPNSLSPRAKISSREERSLASLLWPLSLSSYLHGCRSQFRGYRSRSCCGLRQLERRVRRNYDPLALRFLAPLATLGRHLDQRQSNPQTPRNPRSSHVSPIQDNVGFVSGTPGWGGRLWNIC